MSPQVITLLYFAAVRDAMGASEETLDLPREVLTVGDLARLLEGRPALSGKLGQVRFAVNETFADPDTKVAHGDVVALIPPVAGG